MTFLYPQLSSAASRTLIQELLPLSPETILQNGKYSCSPHRLSVFSATGGLRVPQRHLADVMETITAHAKACGFPQYPNTAGRLRFDADTAAVMHEKLLMSPSEAAREGVWNHLCCVTLPHIVRWRFPEDSAERFLSGRRNTCERLWRRTFLLGDPEQPQDPLWIMKHLGEDEIVQLMERPQLHGRPVLARTTARLFLQFVKATSVNRRDLFRELQKRLRRLAAVIEFDTLTDSELEEVLLDLLNRTCQTLA